MGRPRTATPKVKQPREAWRGSFGFASDQGYQSLSDGLIPAMNDKVKEILTQCGQEMLAEVRRTCPVRTGRLLATHKMRTFDDRPAAIVYMGDEWTYYGRIIHNGEKYKLKPPAIHKWFKVAQEANEKKVARLIQAEMKKFLDQGAGQWKQLSLFD